MIKYIIKEHTDLLVAVDQNFFGVILICERTLSSLINVLNCNDILSHDHVYN